MIAITRQSRVLRIKDVISTEMNGETVMMSIAHGSYYGLNNVGTRVWSLMQQTESIDEICRQLETEFVVNPAVCETEVLAFVLALAQHKLISVQ
jgi:hypothetical protein